MKRMRQGQYEIVSTVGEHVRAFVPVPLPPSPPIDWSPALRQGFDDALVALGRLDSVTSLLPDVSLFLYTYVRKEAVLSSMIEGTQSSLSDLLLFEMEEQPGAPLDDVREVSNYVAAMDHGLARLRDGFPLSLRLLREVHRKLLADGRGCSRNPGEFRTSQNWIGGTRPGNATYVPPPPQQVTACMGALERFLNDQPEPTSPLLKAALAHVQFETIHPFLDGNGRLGRLLITLILCERQVLRDPMLYLSLFFKTHRQAYYELLNRVRIDGDWEAWLDYFAEAVTVTAGQAIGAARASRTAAPPRRHLAGPREADRTQPRHRQQDAGSSLQPRADPRTHRPRTQPRLQLPRLSRHPQRGDRATRRNVMNRCGRSDQDVAATCGTSSLNQHQSTNK